MSSDLRDDVKNTLCNPAAVVMALGLDEGAKKQAGNGLSIRCPAHDEKNASCSVTIGPDGTIRVKCYACDLAGDVFTLVAAVHRLDVHRDFAKVLERAAELAHIDPTRPAAERPRPPRPEPAPAPTVDLQAEWNALSSLDEDVWTYLRNRGLEEASLLCREATSAAPEPIASLARGGWRLAVAVRAPDGTICGIQLRRIDAGEDRFRFRGSASHGVFGDPLALATATRVVICEGMTDYLAASTAFAKDSSMCVLGVAGAKNLAALGKLPLKGKTVIVATDADEPGEACATEITDVLSASGARTIRACPRGAKDLAAMAQSGGSIQSLVGDATSTNAGAPPSSVRVRGERAKRIAEKDLILSFGVRYLNACLGGIHPRDVILIGAKTGVGKTALAAVIAKANALRGKRVHYIALEAEELEIERRIKYQFISERLWDATNYSPEAKRRLNFLDWSSGLLDDLTAPFEEKIDAFVAEHFSTLYTFYRVGDFNVGDLERLIISVQHSTDLIIIDHLHYVDFDDESENRGLKRVVKRIRDIALSIGKPIVVVAHVRKSERKGAPLIPTIEDFHGSSDIAKIGTKAIMVARADDIDAPPDKPYLWSTYLHAVKCRREGERTRYVGVCAYNARLAVYEPRYALGRLRNNGEKMEDVPREKWPDWAERGLAPQERR